MGDRWSKERAWAVIIDMEDSNLLDVTIDDNWEHRDSSDEYSNYNKGIQEW